MTANRPLLLILLALTFALPAPAGGGQAAPSSLGGRGAAYVPGEVLVKFKGPSTPELTGPVHGAALAAFLGTLPPEARSSLKRVRATVKRGFPSLRVLQVQLPADLNVPQAIQELTASSAVEYAEPNFVVHAVQVVPRDPNFASQWALQNTGQSGGAPGADIDAPDAWVIKKNSAGTVVAVIDTGVDYRHRDLTRSMWINPQETDGNGIDDDNNGWTDDVYGINTVSNTGDPLDDDGHGTHCAGIIGALGNNNRGVCGVAWRGRIMALKFLDSTGSGSVADAVTCIKYALALKTRQGYRRMVLSNSWGWASSGPGDYSQTLYDAIKQARNAGVLFVAAAGNDGTNNDTRSFYPACYQLDNIISVGASDRFDQKAPWSNYGVGTVHLFAPGVNILSTYPGNQYVYLSGTSMACPQVSGAAALVWNANHTLSWRGVKARLLNWVDQKNTFDNCLSGGRLNLFRALVGP